MDENPRYFLKEEVNYLGKKINFEIDKFQLLEDSENSQLSTLRMWIVSEGDNKHNIPISWEAIQDAKESLVGKPILTYHDKLFDRLGGHDKGEVAVGVFLRSEDIFEETDSEGKRWMGANCYLWKKYYPDIIDILKRDSGKTAVSMEIEVLDGIDNGDGYEDIKLFSFMGVTMIGCEPAIPNARAEVLQFSALVKETEQIVNSFASGYRGIDFTIPEPVKTNSQKGLSLYEEYKMGGNPYHLATARHLTSSQQTQPSRIKKLYNSLNNKSKQNLTEKTGDGHIGFMLLGGRDCMVWCKELMTQMEDADNSKSHFTLNAGNSIETEDYKLKKKEFEKEEVVEEKMAEAVEEEKKEEKPFAEESKEEEKSEKPFAEEEKPVEEKMAETPEEEKAEPASEEKTETPSEEDKENARMSLDGYADVSAQLSMLEMETEGAKELGSQYVSPKAGEAFSVLVEKVKELYSQNITLKEYKAGIEKQQFAHIVESTLAEVSEIMPKTKLEECRLSSANFTLETVSAWQNEVKATAFTFAKDGKLKKEDDGIVRYALPFTNFPKKEEGNGSLWG